MFNIHNNKMRAFTLIEIMIVISIIAVLAAVMIPNFTKARSESQLAGCEQNLKTIATAAEMFLVRHKISKTDSGSSIACDVGGQNCKLGGYTAEHDHEGTCLHMDDLVDEGYLKTAPTCPAAGTSTYEVECGHTSGNFTVYCSGCNHAACDLGENFPMYSPTAGLIEH